MPKYVDARAEGEEASSEEESGSEEEEDEGGEDEDEEEDEGVAAAGPGGGEDARLQAEAEREEGLAGPQKGKLTISLKHNKDLTCHVCGKRGHCAGFVGAVYLDCPNKPCYLCKGTGHTTLTCPFRTNPETGCAQASGLSSEGTVAQLLSRQLDGRRCQLAPRKLEWHVDAAILKLHSRRCTCLEYHPSSPSLVLSGDKKGQVAIWDFVRVSERTVYGTMHEAITQQIRFLGGTADPGACASTGADGKLKLFDVETGQARQALNMNPGGWIPGVTTEKTWTMLYALGSCPALGLLAAGDSRGSVHFVDPRQPRTLATQLLHKKGTKVNCLDFSPLVPTLLMSGGNDWTCRLHDLRRLGSAGSPGGRGEGGEPPAAQLTSMDHPRVVSTAYFSPRTGSKLLTTCLDNRVRVWDKLLLAGGPPSREIVHSHDFNRYLSPFRAEWDPKDADERLFVIGRYISEDFNGAALHPVDIIDAATGRAQAELVDPNLSTISPVNKPHPTLEVIVSGSSRSLYAWKARVPGEEAAARQRQSRPGPRDPEGLGPGDGPGGYFAFDADDEGGKKKRKAAPAAKAGTAGQEGESPPAKQPRRRAQKEGYEAKSALESGKAKSKAKGKGKGKAAAPAAAEQAAAAEEDEEEEEEAPEPSARGKKGAKGGKGRGKAAAAKVEEEEEDEQEESEEEEEEEGEGKKGRRKGAKAAKPDPFAKFAKKPGR